MSTEANTPSRGQKVAADVSALLRARNPLLLIVTKEEARVEGFLAEAAAQAAYLPRFWDVAQGVTKLDGNKDTALGETADPSAALAAIRTRAETTGTPERGVWVLRDLGPWLAGPQNAATVRQIRNLARFLPGVGRERAQAIIMLSPTADIPAELAGHATVIEWPLPDRAEIAATLDAALNALPASLKETAAPNGTRDAAIDAAVGLSGEEAAACYARSLVQSKKIDPAVIASEKRRIIARERVLEWYDPIPGGLDAVGGLDALKTWLLARKNAYSPKARAYGLPAPKGAILVGPPGTGKSLVSKCIATAWGVPLLRLDLGALKGKFVGESEGNLRKALRVIEAIGRCVVWLDEIEKAMQGATSGSADGGVSADALGTILSWMQERTSEAFVVATSNDAAALPPELLRKGRFDEVWFVDLPNETESKAVLAASLRQYGRGEVKVDFDAIAPKLVGFTGSEIAAIVPDALYAAFADDAREINTADILNAAATVVPLSKTAAEKIDALRKWSKGRARPATTPLSDVAVSTSRQLDF